MSRRRADIMGSLNHFDSEGRPRMVDTSGKDSTRRVATARGSIRMKPSTAAAIARGEVGKGDVLGVARLAGVMATKWTPHLIPLCHPIAVDAADVDVAFDKADEDAANRSLKIQATVTAVGRTGVEMEALTAVASTALTVYDMCKSLDREMEIGDICLVQKSGGESGDFCRPDSQSEGK